MFGTITTYGIWLRQMSTYSRNEGSVAPDSVEKKNLLSDLMDWLTTTFVTFKVLCTKLISFPGSCWIPKLEKVFQNTLRGILRFVAFRKEGKDPAGNNWNVDNKTNFGRGEKALPNFTLSKGGKETDKSKWKRKITLNVISYEMRMGIRFSKKNYRV